MLPRLREAGWHGRCFIPRQHAGLVRCPGCGSTQNRESTGGYVDDTTITTKVKTAIYGEESLRSADNSVKTFKGTVQLSGFVDSTQRAQRAEEVTLAVAGVEHVKNSLIVK